MKKVIVSSDSIRAGMSLMAHAINPKSALPVTRNVLLRVSKGKIQMVATDTELTVIADYPAETPSGTEPFELLIPFDFLKNIVSLIRSAPVMIEHPSARKASIIEGDDVFKLDSLDKLEEFPKLPVIPKQNSLQLPGDFIELLQKAMLTVGKGDVKPALLMANLEIGKKESKLISSDMQTLFSHSIKVASKEPDQILFSSKLAKAVHDMKGAIEIQWTKNQVALSSESVVICCTRSEDMFPNVKMLLQVKEDANLILERSLLITVLKKLCVNSMPIKEATLYLTKDAGKINFETQDLDMSRTIRASIPGSYIGSVEKLSLNPVKLLTMMEQVNTDKIRMHIEAPEKAIMITTEENADYLGLIMPLKINEKA